MKYVFSYGALVLLTGMAITGCAATHATSFIHPDYDFGQIERVAVVPFENLSNDQGAANYVTRVFVTELLSTGAFDVVEPGEVTRVIGSFGTVRGAELSLEQLKKLGDDLKVQSVIFGTVGESAQMRSSSGTNAHIVSIDVRMVDAQTGTTVWSSLVNAGGPGFFARLFGADDQSRGTAVHKAVRKAIATLVK